MENFSAVAVTYLSRIVVAVLIWVVGKRLIRLLLDFMERRMKKANVDESLHSFLTPLLRMLLQVLLFLTVAATLGIEITTFAAIIGAASFAVGLAFQGSLSNFAGGVLILILKPFTVGDFIEAAGYSGTVKEIQVFYTIIRTPDNQKVIIPNADLSNSSAVNYSSYDTRRANIKIPISYKSDVKRSKEVIQQVAHNHPLVLKDPSPMIVLGEYGNDGLILYVRVWAERSDYWTMYFDFLEQVKVAFDEAGVEIPYRQLDVHIMNED